MSYILTCIFLMVCISVCVCCCVLLCAAVCCRVLPCAAVCCRVLPSAVVRCCVLPCAVVCCRVLLCAAVCCSVLQCTAVCVFCMCVCVCARACACAAVYCSKLLCTACSVLQCSAVWFAAVHCSALQCVTVCYRPSKSRICNDSRLTIFLKNKSREKRSGIWLPLCVTLTVMWQWHMPSSTKHSVCTHKTFFTAAHKIVLLCVFCIVVLWFMQLWLWTVPSSPWVNVRSPWVYARYNMRTHNIVLWSCTRLYYYVYYNDLCQYGCRKEQIHLTR